MSDTVKKEGPARLTVTGLRVAYDAIVAVPDLTF